MPYINDHRTSPQSLLDSISRKVNVAGSEPRVVVEFDKLVYIPGIKFKYETLEQIYNSSVTAIATSVNTGSQTGGTELGGNGNSPMIYEMQKVGEPTTYNPSNPTSGTRFEYIKCMMMTYLVDACLPLHYYPFMLAVAYHETGFGTLGQGRPQNGSFIVGYGCPGSCNMTYKSIKTQVRMFAKRIKEAMKSRHAGIKDRGYMTYDDISYFHQGGDKGYNTWVWSADGANWKRRVKNYYDQIRAEMGAGALQTLSSSQNKWRCSAQASGLQTLNFTNSACSGNYVTLTHLSQQVTDNRSEEVEDTYEAPRMTLQEALRPPEGVTDVYYVTDDEIIDIPPTEEEINAMDLEDLVPYNYEISQNFSTTADSGKITFPLANKTYGTSVVTSRYYTENKSRPTHYGIDLVPARGRCAGWTVVAAWGGKVTLAGWIDGGGYTVQITHSNGLITHYLHMQKGSIMVTKGQEVKAGDPLGKCGNTGASDGAHLHFEIVKQGGHPWKKASKINPRPYLEGSAKASVDVNSLPTGGAAGSTVTGEVVKNKVFDYCVGDSLKTMNSKYFTDLGSGSYFAKYDEKTKQDVHVYGFKAGSIAEDSVDSLTCVHKFTADGVFEAKLYINLGESDSAYIRVDGKTYASFTSADNGVVSIEPIYMSFINTAGSSEGVETLANEANEHVIDLYVQDQSGKAEIGYMCVALSELEGGAISQNIKYRTKVDWIEQGDVVFEKTIMLEDDIKSWEVSSHFDTDSSTARVTLDNTTRIYSPTYVYGDIAFPRNKHDSEFTYFEQGELRHVISEGTPVRIYAGYGDDLVRVFTGFITGEVEDDADSNTVTFECVDMYSQVENHIFMTKTSYPEVGTHEEVANGVTNKVNEGWVMSSIVHNIANKSGLAGWRIVEDDLQYPDIVIQETYYIDIDKGAKVATVWDAKAKRYVKKTIGTVKTLEGFKNPYVMSIDFEQGTRASDAIHQLIGDTMFKAYCDRYGTFKLEHLIRMYEVEPKWEFIDNENLTSLNTSVDYTRTRNHLMVLGNQGQTEHFVDKDLIRATRGKVRSAQVEVDWIDESYGASAYGEKKAVADRLFLDMKRQSRTFNVDVKGNPLIDVLDGCYIYSEDSSVQGYYIVKGHTLQGNAENMTSSLELTWGIEGYTGMS